MKRLLRWLVVIPFALVAALSFGLIGFFIASAVVPELGLMVGTGFQALITSIFDEAIAGSDPSGRFIAALALSGRLALAIFVLPMLLVAIASESFGLRGGLSQITGTGLLATVLPLAMLQFGRSPTPAEARVMAALFFTGAVMGLVYWLIAGRKAGTGSGDASSLNVPASPGS